MLNFILKKILYAVLVLFGVFTVIFFLFQIIPGDPVNVILGQHTNKESVEAVRKDLALDRPVLIRYGQFINNLSPISYHSKNPESIIYLDETKYQYLTLLPLKKNAIILKLPYLMRSYITKREVSEIIKDSLPETIVLAISAMLIASLLGIALGILSAILKGKWIDKLMFIMSILGTSAPSFLVGLVMAWLFGYILADYTGLNPTGSLYSVDDFGNGEYLDLKNIILPALTLGIRPLAVIMQLTRDALLETMSQDYIRTAFAKGLSFKATIRKHALKNSLNPVVTSISSWLSSLMAGAIFVEMIFSWKGIGYEVYSALEKNDLPVVIGCTIVFAIIYVIVNILVDIIYWFIDPRVKLTSAAA
jgi:peptide/nickel transport system permease protein